MSLRPDQMGVHRISYGAGTFAVLDRRDAHSGLDVVLVHAFPLSRAMWEPQVRSLASRHRVVAIDLRGFGASDPFDGVLTMETAADDVLAVLDRLGVERPVVCGLSMGGYVALAFARRYACRLAGVVLADTKATADDDETRRGRAEMAELALTSGAGAIAEKMLPRLLSDATLSERPDLVSFVRALIESTPPVSIAAALRGMAARDDSSDVLPIIRVPALVVVGSEDEITPPTVAESMVAALPKARLAVIERAGHLSNLEDPNEFTRHIADFLDSIDA